VKYKLRDIIFRHLRAIATNIIPYKPWRKTLRAFILDFGLCHFLNFLYYEYLKYRKVRGEGDFGFENELCVVTIIRDEAPYIQEWIEYHLLVGVEKFYIYDNESKDNLKAVLEPYIKEGIVSYRYISGRLNRQFLAYKDAIRRCKNKTKWLAIIDMDEFIVPKAHEKITDFLKDFDCYSEISIAWVIYGSSGFINKPEGLVIENYKRHAHLDSATESKSIINPRAVREMFNTHWSFMNGLAVDENKNPYVRYPCATKIPRNKICLNHYCDKSWQEFQAKIQRGFADGNTYVRDRKEFDFFDQNDVFDDGMEKYIEPIKMALKKRSQNEL
jgi:hypothetical protein